MTGSLRIVYILPQTEVGGSEIHVVRLAHELKKRGHQVHILCAFGEGALGPWIHELGIPLTALGKKKWRLPALFGIHQWLKTHPVDIVHTYLFGLHLFAGLPAKLAGVPLILSSRRGVDLSQPGKLHGLEIAGNLFCDGVVANAHAVRDWALSRENLKPGHIVTLYNGVDLAKLIPGAGRAESRREFSIPDSSPLIGTVANFSSMKGYPDLIQTAAKILKVRPDCRFLFVGGGPLETQMRQAAAFLGNKIIFTGSRKDVPKLLAAMDFFAFASHWEGIPNVILEAMAMSLPVVSTPAGGIPEIITDYQTGRIVPMRNPEAMAQVLLDLLETPAKAQALGAAARKTVENQFTLERMADDYENFYLSLMDKPAGRKPIQSAAVEAFSAGGV